VTKEPDEADRLAAAYLGVPEGEATALAKIIREYGKRFWNDGYDEGYRDGLHNGLDPYWPGEPKR
jgi:Zn-dependent protease with chaperone function